MKNKLILVCLSVFFTLNGCFYINNNCKYSITEEYLDYGTGECDLGEDVFFNRIEVDSFDHNGFPLEIHRKEMFVARRIKKDVITSRIYFYKLTENYRWEELRTGEYHKILPIKMLPSNWYMISGLRIGGSDVGRYYIFIDEQGNFKPMFFNPKGPW